MNPKNLSILKCPNCGNKNLRNEVYEHDEKGLIVHGRVLCTACNEWFKINNYILDFLPLDLKDQESYKSFAQLHEIDSNAINSIQIKSKEYKAQNIQMDFFKEDSHVYDKDVSNMRFYQISDRICFQSWMKKLSPGQFVLDIAGGTGRQAIPLAQDGHKVISIDISEEMLNLALKKARESKLLSKISFILADATLLPFFDNSFDAAICYGSLHHLPEPAETIKEVGRVLIKGGLWYSYDPNKSPARFIFDLAMKINKLYDEKAAGDELLNKNDLYLWCKKAQIEADIQYSTYLLPHLINIMPDTIAYFTLKYTDLFFNRLPGLNSFGGIIISEGIKF